MTAVFVEAVQRLMIGFGAELPRHGADGQWGAESAAAFDILTSKASADMGGASDIPDDYWPMLSKIESGDRPYVKAATSSASGLFQFIKATWQGEGGKWGSDASKAFGGLTPSTDEQLGRAKTFTAKNAAALSKAGIPINKASLYAAHFLGVTTAVKVIGADVKASAGALAGAAATKANPSILKDKTVGEFLSWLHRKTGEWAR